MTAVKPNYYQAQLGPVMAPHLRPGHRRELGTRGAMVDASQGKMVEMIVALHFEGQRKDDDFGWYCSSFEEEDEPGFNSLALGREEDKSPNTWQKDNLELQRVQSSHLPRSPPVSIPNASKSFYERRLLKSGWSPSTAAEEAALFPPQLTDRRRLVRHSATVHTTVRHGHTREEDDSAPDGKEQEDCLFLMDDI